jgi:hypothetical protein
MIRLTRGKGYADRLRAYKVVLDGQPVDDIRAGEIKDVPVTSGHHTLQLKVD